MIVDLQTHLDELGFGVVTPFTYQVRGGAVAIGTTGIVQIIIAGNNDFCVTDIWVLMKGVGGAEGGDFTMRDIHNNVDFQNRIMPVDTGVVDLPKVPIQTIPGEPSMLTLPWILPAGAVMEFTAFARYGGITNFDVVLDGYKLDTIGGHVPYRPMVYMFNGSVNDLAANTYNEFQEVLISGPSALYCTMLSSNWDTGAANVDVRELITDGTTGHVYSKRQIVGDRLLPRPYDDSFETSLPLPFVIKNGTTLRRQVSNVGAAATRRPEFFVFGWFDTRSDAQLKRSTFDVQ
jgi:hypothetical protein